MNITQLKAKVKAAQKANAKAVAAAATKSCLEAKLALETSESLFNSKVMLAASSSQTQALQTMIDECAAIIENVPVHNPKTRTNRVWAGSRRFQFGAQINLMYQLATGILYSCAEHKQLLLAHTGLDLELLEQIVDAFGTPEYYSRTMNTIVKAKPYSVERATAAVEVMQSELDVIVDTSNLTAEAFSLEFGKAVKTAQENKVAADEAIQEADLEL